MSIVRWEPIREIDLLHRQLDRLFENVEIKTESSYLPAMELRELPEAYLLKTALPGIRSEDIDIQATPEAVTISAEHRYEKTEQETASRTEFRYGKFFRQLVLPARIDSENVVASYENGILILTLPKAQQNRVKKITVPTVKTLPDA